MQTVWNPVQRVESRPKVPTPLIAPSILAADFTRLGEQIRDAEQGGADLIHVDVMDGRFVPNISMGPVIVEAARRSTTLPLDVHLMIVEPDHLLPAFAKAGASRLTVHQETCPHLHRTLQAIRELGCSAGVAINPGSPAELLGEILPLVDLVLVMTVNPGFGGQSFLTETLGKIGRLRAVLDAHGLPVRIEVDGGITEATAPQVVEAGASVLVAGTSIFNQRESVAEAIRRLRASLDLSGAQANEKPGFPGLSTR
jgi:ribulose-phosphate 3-epimerase